MIDYFLTIQAIGIDARKMTEFQLFELFGKIMRDDVVHMRRNRAQFSTRKAVEMLTSQEKLALKERLVGVVPISSAK